MKRLLETDKDAIEPVYVIVRRACGDSLLKGELSDRYFDQHDGVYGVVYDRFCRRFKLRLHVRWRPGELLQVQILRVPYVATDTVTTVVNWTPVPHVDLLSTLESLIQANKI